LHDIPCFIEQYCSPNLGAGVILRVSKGLSKELLRAVVHSKAMKLKIKKLHENAVVPTRAHKDDSGMDLYAYGDHVVPPHTTYKIPTGIALEIEQGYAWLIWDKSSIGSKGIKTMGGVFDAGYRGEVILIVHNLNNESYTFLHGNKVAQMLIQKIEFPEIEEVKELSNSPRGENGFGSTGK